MGGYIYSDIRRDCRVCGAEFRITNANSRLCSPECYRESRVRSSMKWDRKNPEKRKEYQRRWYRNKGKTMGGIL